MILLPFANIDASLIFRVKSLSKGSTLKRDPLSSSNLRDSTALPLSSTLPTEPTFEDKVTNFNSEKNRFGWSRQIEREPSPPFRVDHVPSGRAEENPVYSKYLDYCQGERGGKTDMLEDDFVYPEEVYERDKPSRVNSKWSETYRNLALEERQKSEVPMKQKDPLAFEAKNSHLDDDLDALLKVNFI